MVRILLPPAGSLQTLGPSRDAHRKFASNLAGPEVHDGALFAFADDLGGTVGGLNVPEGFRTTTIESKSNIFHACPPGRLIGIAVPLHVGRRTMVVQTSIYRSDGSTRSVQQRRNWTTGQSTPHGLPASRASVTRTRKTRPPRRPGHRRTSPKIPGCAPAEDLGLDCCDRLEGTACTRHHLEMPSMQRN